MENKRWSFKAPGETDGKEVVVDPNEIRSVYDLLDILRNDGLQSRKKKQTAAVTTRTKAVLLPFASRMPAKRRHPSA
ncbi:hypothetical protein [Paenibacillus sp. S150]|uniref:hypothetical protein n=1 Tax=Paenibacillus sp. S150 TaxID=2749826 RepID=UPI001C565664|nr:hypothetical protein [Paenibacillus sp. S150]MBW4082390.1 hypothetical protein [Paenibacillus sp. S150]